MHIRTFEENMVVLASAHMGKELVEVTEDGRIQVVDFLGKIWRRIQTIFGFGRGFADCKLEVVAERIHFLMKEHLLDFSTKLAEPTQKLVKERLQYFIDHSKRHDKAQRCFERVSKNVEQLGSDENSVVANDFRAFLADAAEGTVREGVSSVALVEGLKVAITLNDVVMMQTIGRELALKRFDQLPDNMPLKRRQMLQLLSIVGYTVPDQEILAFIKQKNQALLSDSLDIYCEEMKDALKGQDLCERFLACVDKHYDEYQEARCIQLSTFDFTIPRFAFQHSMLNLAREGFDQLNMLSMQGMFLKELVKPDVILGEVLLEQNAFMTLCQMLHNSDNQRVKDLALRSFDRQYTEYTTQLGRNTNDPACSEKLAKLKENYQRYRDALTGAAAKPTTAS